MLLLCGGGCLEVWESVITAAVAALRWYFQLCSRRWKEETLKHCREPNHLHKSSSVCQQLNNSNHHNTGSPVGRGYGTILICSASSIARYLTFNPQCLEGSILTVSSV